MRHLRKFFRTHSFAALLLIYLIYSLLLIFRSSFVIEGTRYFSLFDDEMISIRYAYNLAHGHGLVWNPGAEHIEGYSNPLWTLYMALVHLFPIPIEKTSLVIQLTGMLAMMGTLYYVKAITALLTGGSQGAILLALLLTAFYFPLNNWAIIQGTEVSILTLLLTASTYLVIRALLGHLSLVIFILLGIGALVRLDFIVSAIALILVLLILVPKERFRVLTQGIPVFLLIVLPATGLRWWYYGDLLPNTYYLKMTGFPVQHRVTRGIYFTLKEVNSVILVIPFLFAFLTKNRITVVLLSIFSTNFLYSMYIGGDVWEWFGGANRFLAIAMPLFFITLAQAVHTL
jgi:arabinofuranosyltransferase